MSRIYNGDARQWPDGLYRSIYRDDSNTGWDILVSSGRAFFLYPSLVTREVYIDFRFADGYMRVEDGE